MTVVSVETLEELKLNWLSRITCISYCLNYDVNIDLPEIDLRLNC